MSPEQDTQRQILPLDHLVESSPSVQRVDYLPEIDKQPSRLNCTTDVPLILDQPDSQPSDIEHSTTDTAATAEPMGSTENNSPDTECDKLPDVPGDTGDNETIGPCTSDTHEHKQVSSVRRSTRTKDQPNRLTYTELGSPLLAMMQSFLLGLSTDVDTDFNENSVGSTSSTSAAKRGRENLEHNVAIAAVRLPPLFRQHRLNNSPVAPRCQRPLLPISSNYSSLL